MDLNKLEFIEANRMFGKIIGLISCLMCAFPFFIIGIFNKDSKEPISFWSGDTTLKSKVKNVAEYNEKMAALYKKCAIVFVISGIVWLISPVVGVVAICFDCTLGIWLVYKNYKRILDLYS
jgi:hypothetical protein